jgi:hypothetical protein
MTGAPGQVTGGNYDQSTGVGVHLFDDYAGLFAGGGSFDIPENYTLGCSGKPPRSGCFGPDLILGTIRSRAVT